jgi:hypothetical protein
MFFTNKSGYKYKYNNSQMQIILVNSMRYYCKHAKDD